MSGAGSTAGVPPLQVRPAAEADLPALAALERVAFPEPWSRRLLAEEIRHPVSIVLVAEEDGELVAYASFRRAADEAELLRVAVALPARGRGVARRLVRAGLAELSRRGVVRCFLEVRPHNAPARALYRRLGFQEAGRRRAYYPDGSDALVLSRNVSGASSRAGEGSGGRTDRRLDRSPSG